MTCHVHACQRCPMFWTQCINCHSVKIDSSITLLTISYEHEDRYCLVNADKRRQFIDQCSLQITRQLLKIRHGQHAGWPSIHHPHPEHTHTHSGDSLDKMFVTYCHSTVQQTIVCIHGSHSNVRIKNLDFSGPVIPKNWDHFSTISGHKEDTVMPGFTRYTSSSTWQLYD